ncbi:MAG: hypothetical protein CMB52_03665 [Euryarchaeota archaeon]|nr:hypothetical protein [Euryarchaeota archaeon]|tara:strand:- start:7 stop:291 length:285 start_codon:yes stop_codon:yes gene_type:complete
MAKRLTKALRGKRRWIGLIVPNCNSRGELEKILGDFAPSDEWKLVVFEGEKAIMKVPISDLDDWRTILDRSDSEMHSVTTSGKIRLVKERMGLI